MLLKLPVSWFSHDLSLPNDMITCCMQCLTSTYRNMTSMDGSDAGSLLLSKVKVCTYMKAIRSPQ